MSVCVANEIWPKGVGYDQRSGYVSVQYNPATDKVSKVCDIMNRFKNTATAHNFSCKSTQTLDCTWNGKNHMLTLPKLSKPFLAKVTLFKAAADVDEDPGDTCIDLEIKGYNIGTKKKFTFTLLIFRYPNKRVTCKFKIED